MKVGDIYYNIRKPERELEVIEVCTNKGHNHCLLLDRQDLKTYYAKYVELKEDSRYGTYSKTIEGAIRLRIAKLEKEIQRCLSELECPSGYITKMVF